ncbi:unnamed protein product [Mesocestoides corti]|uniref:Uncharacterized protein n=1 Tax=Mesocestoides corti TaxID=53468 RepID=A0A0R3U7Q2_MESCO|nr:unnamed protein product [Mesocestoides corti]
MNDKSVNTGDPSRPLPPSSAPPDYRIVQKIDEEASLPPDVPKAVVLSHPLHTPPEVCDGIVSPFSRSRGGHSRVRDFLPL